MRWPKTDQIAIRIGGARWTRAVEDHPGRPLYYTGSIRGRESGRSLLAPHSDRLLTQIIEKSSLSSSTLTIDGLGT
jgi:hypothetical protein